MAFEIRGVGTLDYCSDMIFTRSMVGAYRFATNYGATQRGRDAVMVSVNPMKEEEWEHRQTLLPVRLSITFYEPTEALEGMVSAHDYLKCFIYPDGKVTTPFEGSLDINHDVLEAFTKRAVKAMGLSGDLAIKAADETYAMMADCKLFFQVLPQRAQHFLLALAETQEREVDFSWGTASGFQISYNIERDIPFPLRYLDDVFAKISESL